MEKKGYQIWIQQGHFILNSSMPCKRSHIFLILLNSVINDRTRGSDLCTVRPEAENVVFHLIYIYGNGFNKDFEKKRFIDFFIYQCP